MADQLPELSHVELMRDWTCMVTIPKGWRGTVVHVFEFQGRVAYEVEFCDDQGRGVVVQVPAAFVEPASAQR